MRVRYPIVAALALLAIPGSVVLVGHVDQLDPSTVPTGFLSSHGVVTDFPVGPFARAVRPDGADVFVQHVRLAPNTATPWHTHPGPVIVNVARGSLTYEDAQKGKCRRLLYAPASGKSVGFIDRGFGHVHRVVAGPDGVDFYATYVLPRGSQTHLTTAPAPEECV